MSWPLVKLSDVATINPRPPRDVDESQQVTFVAMASASEDGHLLSSETRILSETKKGFTYFARHDVLLAKITPCFENGKCLRPGQIPTEIGFGSTEFHVIRPDTERLDGLYLFYLVWSEQFRFLGEKSMSGAAGQKRIGSDFLKGFEIPLPPLPEQKRIAAILDKADAIRRKRQQAIQLADDFLRAVFLDMFGDPVTNPKGWEVKSIASVTEDWKGGASIKPEDFTDSGFPVLHKGAIHQYGKIVLDESKKTFVSNEFAEVKKGSLVCRGCVAITLRDLVPSGPSIGLMADLSDYETDKYLLSQGAYGFTVKPDKLHAGYLVALSNHDGFRQEFKKISVGSTQIHIRSSDLKELALPVPPVELQRKYGAIRQAVIIFQRKAESAEGQGELFESLSQKAFRGEL